MTDTLDYDALEQLALNVKRSSAWELSLRANEQFARACTPDVILALLAAARRGAGDTELLEEPVVLDDAMAGHSLTLTGREFLRLHAAARAARPEEPQHG